MDVGNGDIDNKDSNMMMSFGDDVDGGDVDGNDANEDLDDCDHVYY